MDFNTAEELLELCRKENKSIAEIMRLREIIYGEDDADTVDSRMKKSLGIMRNSAHNPLTNIVRS
ncbi:MAG: L-serine ammonia-lyase, iron-sulfur-dependent, subunit alpha, partial [Clostridia bacterium]|nr:L-serine ammonia-lyase, iron-sulfur-dependent, subunit alpha [Clostridia bacterium]